MLAHFFSRHSIICLDNEYPRNNLCKCYKPLHSPALGSFPLHGPSMISYLIPQSIILSSALRDLNINAVRCEILMAVPMKYAVISLISLPNTLILS